MKNNKQFFLILLIGLLTTVHSSSAMRWVATVCSAARGNPKTQTIEKQFVAAIQKGDIETMSTLLEKHHIDLNRLVPLSHGCSILPLEIAIKANQLEAVCFLIERGASATRANSFGESLLNTAIGCACDPAIVVTLLENGVHAQDYQSQEQGRKGLHYLHHVTHEACRIWSSKHTTPKQRENLGKIAELLAVTININRPTQNRSAKTCLHIAAEKNPAVIPMLLRLGANPNLVDNQDKTPLDVIIEKLQDPELYQPYSEPAIQQKYYSAAELLLIYGGSAQKANFNNHVLPEWFVAHAQGKRDWFLKKQRSYKQQLQKELEEYSPLPGALAGLSSDYCDAYAYEEKDYRVDHPKEQVLNDLLLDDNDTAEAHCVIS